MNIGIILTVLAFTSALTTLTVEGIKKMLDAKQKQYQENLLAAIVSIVLSIIAAVLYILYYNIPFSVQVVVLVICLAFFTWLASMVGYDKIKQLFEQLGKKKEDK